MLRTSSRRQPIGEYSCHNVKIEGGGFGVSENQLNSLDLSSVFFLETDGEIPYLKFQDNPLFSIDAKNGAADALEVEFSSNGDDDLVYVCTDESEITIWETAAETYDLQYLINTACPFAPGGFYPLTVNITENFDGEGCTPSENAFPGMKFSVDDGTTTGTFIGNQDGENTLGLPAGTYVMAPVFTSSYFTSTPPSVTVTVSDALPLADVDFCIAPNGIHHDLGVFTAPAGAAIPGFDAAYVITVKNNGTVPETGSIAFSFDDASLDFVSAFPVVTSQFPGYVNWDFANLQPFASQEFNVIFNLNSPVETPPLIQGSVLGFTATGFIAGEETPIDNVANLSQTVVNALDPNDKTCLEGEAIGPEMAGQYLHYLIRFENLGDYPAVNVTVEDLIDLSKFDIATLEPIDGSHPFTTRIIDDKVEFIFDNIMLPFDDANNDGYVLFRIKTKPTLILGDSVSNTAGIYFNFNPPVITNTATTTLATMGVGGDMASLFSIWPNPVADDLHIESKTAEVQSVSIFDLMGREVLRVKGHRLETIDVSGLATGEYLARITSPKGSATSKFVKK